MSQNIRPGASAAGQPADSTGTSRDRITEPPAMVNHLPVIAWRPRPAGPGQLPGQFYVICVRPRDMGERPYIVWTVAYDPGYQGGSWVAGNGRYDLTWDRAQQVLGERGGGEQAAVAGASSCQAELSLMAPSAPRPVSRQPSVSGEGRVMTTPARGEQRLARAALTFLAEPADPVLGGLIRDTDPAYVLRRIQDGGIPAGMAQALGLPGPALRRAVAVWRSRLGRLPDRARLAEYQRRGIRLLCPGDQDWPAALDDLGDRCPYALWALGAPDPRACCARSVAIAGSRAATGYGAHIAGQFAGGLAARGWTVISGAAYGIDAAAHRGALTVPGQGPTIAVLDLFIRTVDGGPPSGGSLNGFRDRFVEYLPASPRQDQARAAIGQLTSINRIRTRPPAHRSDELGPGHATAQHPVDRAPRPAMGLHPRRRRRSCIHAHRIAPAAHRVTNPPLERHPRCQAIRQPKVGTAARASPATVHDSGFHSRRGPDSVVLDDGGQLLPEQEARVEDAPDYGENPWEDDWDWEWPEEPQVTYHDAIDQLRGLIQARTDIRIDWNGKRGLPRDDARVIFAGLTGNGRLRVRFRSATQLDDFTRIISSAILLADRHAVWYPSEQVITACLMGDYDRFHAAVARELAPRQVNRRFALDSPLGRDVAGVLASVGAFPVAEVGAFPVAETVPAGSHPRRIRLVAANQDLRLLYGPHSREVPSVAIELAGFAAPDAAQAQQILLDYCTAYLFKLGKATGVSLRMWHSEDRLGSQRPPSYSRKMRFPQQRYDTRPAELYACDFAR